MENREIERKFLVRGDAWRADAEPQGCVQGYLAYGPPTSVRVRVIGDHAYLTIKGSIEEEAAGGATDRLEYEYPLPVDEAQSMMNLCTGFVKKTRYRIEYAGHDWEIDVFHDANDGLVVAEIELERPDEPFDKPDWAGEEVSVDLRYLNVNLARKPYKNWRTS